MNDFDLKAKDWDEKPVNIERAQSIAKKILETLKLNKNMTALEYGCGTGLLSFELQPYLGNIYLADNSDGMLEVLREKITKLYIKNMHVLKLNLETQDYIEKKFDLIYLQMVLHHVDNTDKILSKFYKLLNKNGTLCIADLDKEDGSFHGNDFNGHKGFDRQNLAEKLQNAGFKNISVDTAYKMPKQIDAELKSFPIFLMTANS